MKKEARLTDLPLPQHWPLLAISGTDVQERDGLVGEVLPMFRERAIRALVVKADVEKMSYLSGSVMDSGNQDVLLLGNNYSHALKTKTHTASLQEILTPHISSYDIIILLTDDEPPVDTIRLIGENEQRADQSGGATNTVFIHRLEDECRNLFDFILRWLQKKVYSTPVWACVLIGGQSSRMGRPKHLIKGEDGRTWLETTVERVGKVADQVVLSGKGDVPESLVHLPRMVDIVDVKGPLTGILSAMRWNPLVSWLLVACDMPDIKQQGLKWLLSERDPGVWGVVPRHKGTGYSEPLLAFYDFRCCQLFEKLLSADCLRINQVCKESKISNPSIPSELENCWHNCNSPDDL